MKNFVFFITLLIPSLIFCGDSSLSNYPEPYCNLEKLLPFDGHGWFGNGIPLDLLLKQRKVKTIVEVGSWLGNSTRHMASLIPEGGKVYAVDHWLGSVEHQEGQYAFYHALPYLYDQFLSNVIHKGLTDKIVPIRMSSLEAAQVLTVKPDLVYLDGAHDTESVYNDLVAWYPFIQGHGIICGDDWMWATVSAAVVQFATEKHLKLFFLKNFWALLEE